MYVISGSTHQRLGASLAEEMDAEFCGVVNRHFPDGERYIRVLMDVNEQDVVVVQNTFPDKKIVELLLILQAVKEAGAKTVGAMGSVSMLPTRLRDARDEPLAGQIAEADPAKFELAIEGARPAAVEASVVPADLELGRPSGLDPETLLRHLRIDL